MPAFGFNGQNGSSYNSYGNSQNGYNGAYGYNSYNGYNANNAYNGYNALGGYNGNRGQPQNTGRPLFGRPFANPFRFGQQRGNMQDPSQANRQPARQPGQQRMSPQMAQQLAQQMSAQQAAPQNPQAGTNMPQAAQIPQQAAQPRPNQPLPDGVHYESLDRARAEMSHGPQSFGGNDAQTTLPDVKQAADDFGRRLGQMIQNERNASVFYGQLAENARENEGKAFFERTSAESAHRQSYLQGLYKTRFGAEPEIADSEIIRLSRLTDGVELALDEECHSLDDLNWLHENIPDDAARWALQKHLNKKVGQIAALSVMGMKMIYA